ncbi:MAG: threonine/homoserine/homoserine lactone efflux protein, partial [Patiriisocius sp.]
MEIITGFLLGLSTLVFIGAVFFYLIKTAIVSGKKAGVAVASGIIIGDILYVVLLLFGFSEVFENEVFVRWFAFFGGTLLVMIGIRYLIKKRDIS